MDKILLIIKREFFTKIRSKFFIISTLFAPLLLIAFAIGPAFLVSYSSSQEKHLIFVDKTGVLTEKILKRFKDPKYDIDVINESEYLEDEKHYRSLVEKKDIKALIVIPKDSFEQGEITYY